MPPPLAAPQTPEPETTRDLRRQLRAVRSPLNPMAPLLDAFERYLTASARREELLERRITDLERAVADQADLLAALQHQGNSVSVLCGDNAIDIARQAERINGLMPPGEFITDEQFALMQGVGELKESAIDRAGEADLVARGCAGGSEPL